MEFKDIKWLHVEPTSKCQAWCPSCPRNLDGYGLTPGLKERDLSLNTFVEILGQCPSLETIQFCGNYGDPIIARQFLDMVNISTSYVRDIRIHTNGSARYTYWWKELGQTLRDINHEVIFAIDGSAETHEIYRQGTNYDKIIRNAKAFINAGGNAIWQFIPFKHNEKETLFLMAESQRLGFSKFLVQKNVRLRKDPARHWRTGEEYKIEFWEDDNRVNLNKEEGKIIQKHNCMHLDLKSIYLNSLGEIYPCCFLNNVVQYKSETYVGDEVFTEPHQFCLEHCGTKNTESTKRR